MKSPVLIAAHNEEATLGRTLEHIDAAYFEPIVITNGCEDKTANIARSFGAVTIELTEQGKLPAVQAGLRRLGSLALSPVFYTDADSYPLSSRLWSSAMLGAVSSEGPQLISGPIIHIDGESAVEDAIRTVKRQIDARRAKASGLTRCFGANMLSKFDNNETLERVLELPHIWPGEDRAIEELVAYNGGDKVQVTKISASVLTSSRYLPSISHVLDVGKEQARKEAINNYLKRAAPGSIPYGRFAKRRAKKTKV